MNSFNHYSFGAVYEWMTAYQLGICADPAQPGYQHFILQPTAGGSFRYAKGSFESPYGTIASGWTAEDGKMTSCTIKSNLGKPFTVRYAGKTREISLPAGKSIQLGPEL